MEACFLQPMDTIKTRLQLDKGGQKYRGIVHCGRTIAAEEGTRALWKGLTPFAAHLTLKYYLRMGTNAIYQNALRDAEGRLTDARRLAAGFAAGVTEALCIVTPFEVVKIRLQQQKGLENLRYRGPVHCATTIVREEGVLRLWAGAGPTVMRNGTNQMCLFYTKARGRDGGGGGEGGLRGGRAPAQNPHTRPPCRSQNLMDRVLWGKHEGDGTSLQWWQSMASGFSAACVGPVATGPFDVVKTRLMAQERAAGQAAPKYRGFLHALVTIPREEGLRAMWRGLSPRLLRIPPGQAIVWAVSDQVVAYFERHPGLVPAA